MGQRLLTPITTFVRGFLPGDWLNEIDDALSFIMLDPSSTRMVWKHEGIASSFRFVIVSKIEFDLPGTKDFDLLIVGTTKSGFLQRATVGTFSTQVAERSHCSVAVVRVVPKAQKIMHKI